MLLLNNEELKFKVEDHVLIGRVELETSLDIFNQP